MAPLRPPQPLWQPPLRLISLGLLPLVPEEKPSGAPQSGAFSFQCPPLLPEQAGGRVRERQDERVLQCSPSRRCSPVVPPNRPAASTDRRKKERRLGGGQTLAFPISTRVGTPASARGLATDYDHEPVACLPRRLNETSRPRPQRSGRHALRRVPAAAGRGPPRTGLIHDRRRRRHHAGQPRAGRRERGIPHRTRL